VGALAVRTKELVTLDKRLDTLAESRQDFERLRKDVQDLHKLHAEIEGLRDMLGTSRLPLEAQTKPAPTDRVPPPAQLWQDANAEGVSVEHKRVNRPAVDDDLAPPEAAQLWSGPRRSGGLADGEGLAIELPAPVGTPAPPRAALAVPVP